MISPLGKEGSTHETSILVSVVVSTVGSCTPNGTRKNSRVKISHTIK